RSDRADAGAWLVRSPPGPRPARRGRRGHDRTADAEPRRRRVGDRPHLRPMIRRCPNCGWDQLTVTLGIPVDLTTRPPWWPDDLEYKPHRIGRVDRTNCLRCGW